MWTAWHYKFQDLEISSREPDAQELTLPGFQQTGSAHGYGVSPFRKVLPYTPLCWVEIPGNIYNPDVIVFSCTTNDFDYLAPSGPWLTDPIRTILNAWATRKSSSRQQQLRFSWNFMWNKYNSQCSPHSIRNCLPVKCQAAKAYTLYAEFWVILPLTVHSWYSQVCSLFPGVWKKRIICFCKNSAQFAFFLYQKQYQKMKSPLNTKTL